jgi:hypothetical protein
VLERGRGRLWMMTLWGGQSVFRPSFVYDDEVFVCVCIVEPER